MSHQHKDFRKADLPEQELNKHDILASLAITNGFITALAMSHAQLHESYKELTSCLNESVTKDKLDEIRKHETDCNFCLSRLTRSVEQLQIKFETSFDSTSYAEQPQVGGDS